MTQEVMPSDHSSVSRISVFKKHDDGHSGTGKTEALIRIVDGKVQESDAKLLIETSLSSHQSLSLEEEKEQEVMPGKFTPKN